MEDWFSVVLAVARALLGVANLRELASSRQLGEEGQEGGPGRHIRTPPRPLTYPTPSLFFFGILRSGPIPGGRNPPPGEASAVAPAVAY
jgi:hypothetical protein